MKIEFLLMIAALFSILVVGCATYPLSISCQVQVPAEFQNDPPGGTSSTGEPESVRYRKAYEASWWNCVMLKAEYPDGRCPSACSGTAGVSIGCSDGAMDAERQIFHLLIEHDVSKVRRYLQSIAAGPEVKEKTKAYFPRGPRIEKSPNN